MPRESYLTDDDDNPPRRGNATGGGIPAWLWVGGGGGLLAVVVLVVLGFWTFSARQAAVHRDVARAELARVEAKRAEVVTRDAHEGPRRFDVADDGGTRRVGPAVPEVPGEPPVFTLAGIAKAYREDRADADRRFKGQRLRVSCEVRPLRPGWVGTVAELSPNPPPVEPIGRAVGEEVRPPRGPTPNVVFAVPDARLNGPTRVVIEAMCTGVDDDPITDLRLTFTEGRIIPPAGPPPGRGPAPRPGPAPLPDGGS